MSTHNYTIEYTVIPLLITQSTTMKAVLMRAMREGTQMRINTMTRLPTPTTRRTVQNKEHLTDTPSNTSHKDTNIKTSMHSKATKIKMLAISKKIPMLRHIGSHQQETTVESMLRQQQSRILSAIKGATKQEQSIM